MQENELKKKTCYLLFTESVIGIHQPEKSEDEKEVYVLFNGTFFPLLSEDEPYCGNEKMIIDTISIADTFEKKGYEVFFLIGYDLDEMGELMSLSLKNSLVSKGIPANLIYRTPLTEKGYVTITNFISIKDYLKYKALDYNFRAHILRYLNIKIGLLKALALSALYRRKQQSFIINRDGTSTATVVHHFLHKRTGKE